MVNSEWFFIWPADEYLLDPSCDAQPALSEAEVFIACLLQRSPLDRSAGSVRYWACRSISFLSPHRYIEHNSKTHRTMWKPVFLWPMWFPFKFKGHPGRGESETMKIGVMVGEVENDAVSFIYAIAVILLLSPSLLLPGSKKNALAGENFITYRQWILSPGFCNEVEGEGLICFERSICREYSILP